MRPILVVKLRVPNDKNSGKDIVRYSDGMISLSIIGGFIAGKARFS